MRIHFGLLAAILGFALAAPVQAAWYEAKSRHFTIYSDDDPRRIAEFAERLEKFDRAVRLVRGMDDPALTDSRRLKIYVLPSGEAVANFTGRSSARGFYTTRASGSYAFVPRRSGRGEQYDLDAETIFFHEYAHHLQLQQSNMALPAWFAEGFAEFFATAQLKRDGSIMIGNVPQYRLWALGNDASGLSLERMVSGSSEGLTGEQTERLYGQGWLLTHFLTFDGARKGQLARYLAAMQGGMSPLDSARAAFGDLKILERDLSGYKRRRLTAIEVSGKALAVSPAAIRPLSRGAAAMMNVHMRSTRGVNDQTAPALAAEARKIAAEYPADDFARAALAEAEYDAGNYQAADSAADRALGANPQSVHALIYKGRAQMALAEANAGSADWTAVRRWFLKANKLDTENAEALMLFFRSFLSGGQRPSQNAVNGLVYAVALAPSDDGMRMTAVGQLLAENRVAEAKQIFAPLAFQPHAKPEWQARMTKIMAALSGGNAKEALALIGRGGQISPEEPAAQ